MEYNEKMVQAAHRAAYIVKSYPDKTMNGKDGLIELFNLPAIEFNMQMWLAQELGLITDLDDKTDLFTFVKEPEGGWDFGPVVEYIMDMITYGFTHMAKNQTELDEQQFGFWTLGYNNAHILIAAKRLIETKVLATYDLTADDFIDNKESQSTYTFYTLYGNSEQEWSRSRFKVSPDGSLAVPQPEDDTPEEDKLLNSDENAAESEK